MAIETVRLVRKAGTPGECARHAMLHAARQKETVTTKDKTSLLLASGKLDVSSPPPEQKIAAAVATFADVYRLLEEYGPAWYNSKMRRKLQTCLRSVRYFIPDQDL